MRIEYKNGHYFHGISQNINRAKRANIKNSTNGHHNSAKKFISAYSCINGKQYIIYGVLEIRKLN